MPVTAKFSQAFYDRLGHDIVEELVEFLNRIDTESHSALRELNELNYQRFDAKVEQRFAEADLKLERRFAEVGLKLERRFSEVDRKFEQRFAQVDAKLERADAKLERYAAELRGEIRIGLADQRASLLKWMFGFWIATLVPLAGLIVTLRLV